jgi:hypothetical protein
MVVIPGAMDAGLGDLRFWGGLTLALLIARGRGHAVVHRWHCERPVEPESVLRKIDESTGAMRCRRRDSNPRHADYDSAALTD